jgi:hypothetical protein
MMEAAASGLRLIAPAHSAYRAYLDRTIAQLVPCQEVAANFVDVDGLQTLFAGANWWEPDEREAIAAIQAALEGSDQPRASARDRVRREFTWEQATRQLISILEETMPRRSWRWPW